MPSRGGGATPCPPPRRPCRMRSSMTVRPSRRARRRDARPTAKRSAEPAASEPSVASRIVSIMRSPPSFSFAGAAHGRSVRVEGTRAPREKSICLATLAREISPSLRDPAHPCERVGVGPPEPPLFRRFPALAGRLPHRRYVEGPTPVEPLALEGLGGVELWVKRDDRSCPLYGGNKPRKLEFVIGRALERGARRLVTAGGRRTKQGPRPTILGRAAGLATTLVLVDQPVTPKVRESLLLMRAHGAEIVHGRGVAGAALGVLATLARGWLRGEKPYLVPTGGSSALGTLGFVGAALELAEQVRAGVCPEPAELYVAVGSGGTLAGLVLGLRLAGLRTRAVGVLVTDVLPPSPARPARLAPPSPRPPQRP